MAVPAHQATTRHLGALYPFASEPGLAVPGVLIGRDLFGGAFMYDPFELYGAGVLTNPNMIVLGQLGRGKSAFVKSYLWRQAVFGRRAWVVDPKGEYGALARLWGVEPIALRPGGTVCLNPLDAPPPPEGAHTADASTRPVGARRRRDGDGAARPGEETRRRAELLAAVAAASLGRALSPPERTALELAVAAVSATGVNAMERRPLAGDASSDAPESGGRTRAPTLPEVVDALLSPSRHSAHSVRSDVAGLAADGRNVALELRRLVAGDLQGMFDGPTSPTARLDGPLVVLDLSAVYRSSALAVLMTCATAWLQAGLARAEASGSLGVVLVVDEAWAILANLAVARWLQSSWKLSRAWGVSNVAVVHRLSDLAAVGTSGSEQVGLAHGLLADSETRVVYAQAPGEVDRAGELLELSETERELVPHLPRGVALWKLGDRSFLVQHRLSPMEGALVDTDARMAAPAAGRRRTGSGAGSTGAGSTGAGSTGTGLTMGRTSL